MLLAPAVAIGGADGWTTLDTGGSVVFDADNEGTEIEDWGWVGDPVGGSAGDETSVLVDSRGTVSEVDESIVSVSVKNSVSVPPVEKVSVKVVKLVLVSPPPPPPVEKNSVKVVKLVLVNPPPPPPPLSSVNVIAGGALAQVPGSVPQPASGSQPTWDLVKVGSPELVRLAYRSRRSIESPARSKNQHWGNS